MPLGERYQTSGTSRSLGPRTKPLESHPRRSPARNATKAGFPRSLMTGYDCRTLVLGRMSADGTKRTNLIVAAM
jgi:hypothetical protein